MKTPSEMIVRSTLRKLGLSNVRIAKALRARKCKGVRGDSTKCVLVEYLSKKFPSCKWEVCDTIQGKRDGIAAVFIETPQHLNRFIHAFDDGKFEYLTK